MINSSEKQLNDFERSINSTPNAFPLSTTDFQLSNIASRQFCALKPLQNPHWYFHGNWSINFVNCLLIVFTKIFKIIGKLLTGR